MIRILLIALVAMPLLPFSASAFDMVALRDSVGVERKNGKVYVQHRVEPKETLYALSRKYGVSVAQIVDSNPSVETTINIGQVVLIPRKYAAAPAAIQQTATAGTASNRTFTVNSRGEKLHQVEPQQTLYSISRMHAVKVDDIKRWNNLPDNTISVGAFLIVGKGQPVPSKNPIYVSESDDEIAKDSVTETAVASTEPVAATTNPANTHVVLTPQPATPAPATSVSDDDEEMVDSVSGAKKIIETGMAEMIDPKADTNKYLALHKTAPVGTIMQVKNAMNDQVVYVRVIGKLPNTGENNNVVVRLSKKACQKLGAIDQKFRVELSYMP
ncbi:septal ring lytic transglycosylase RlpA family protein [Pontibacter lucknowensis]|uniref:LysM repeat-containing protein n=1 Tax=Pontibacter lucknowensis TaxID=1077936 RepID=A0A1N6W9K4_9BACT|nr:LysM peptidoglycan-binding domain-containing protein [Pontibacter lucknowensis]SIQ86728.1 LysM repeat-containing protein [Pontibacter lucknowensis]